MAAREQKVRAHFLIALTLAVMAFGAGRFLRLQRRRQVQTEYARTEQEIHQYTAKLLGSERAGLQDLATGGADRVSKDAAALLMQVRFLAEQDTAARSPRTTAARERALALIRNNFRRLKQGSPARFPFGESFLRAYYSDVDGSFQPPGSVGLCQLQSSSKASRPLSIGLSHPAILRERSSSIPSTIPRASSLRPSRPPSPKPKPSS